MQKALLVEDSEEFQTIVKSALNGVCDVSIANSAGEAKNYLSKHVFDIILLDIGLPDKSGLELCAEIRNVPENKFVPIFFLTGANETSKKVAGFSIGADDYITKPFDVLEFRSRVTARLTKGEEGREREMVTSRAGIRINLFSHEASIMTGEGYVRVDLTPHEFDILKVLMMRPNMVFSREKLLDSIWGNKSFVNDRTVDKHVSSLRKKLLDKGDVIRTIVGVGYKFCLENEH